LIFSLDYLEKSVAVSMTMIGMGMMVIDMVMMVIDFNIKDLVKLVSCNVLTVTALMIITVIAVLIHYSIHFFIRHLSTQFSERVPYILF